MDVLWNVGSFGVLSIVGVLLTVVIAHFYGAAVLGIYNQVYVIYLLLSQFAVGGIHLSVLKHISQLDPGSGEIDIIFSVGLFLTTAVSATVCVLAFLTLDLFGQFFDSRNVSTGLLYALPGLFFFSLNKTFLMLLNATRAMKAYSVFQSLRYIFMLITLLVLVGLNTSGEKIPLLFSMSEAALVLLLAVYAQKFVTLRKFSEMKEWVWKHSAFGAKAAVGNIFLNIHTHVDILILGLFSTDKIVGIYSLAAMLADGFAQLPIVLRTNVNPIIARTIATSGKAVLENLIKKGIRLSYLVLVPLGLIAVVGFEIIRLLGLRNEFMESFWPFVIIMAGILISSGYLPFQMLLNQTGYPGYQSGLILLVFLTTLGLNLLLVPWIGMVGSALATGVTYALQTVYIRLLVRRAADMRI